jgi:hypothetical protein
MFNCIKCLFQRFKRRQICITAHQIQRDSQQADSHSLPPDYIPIESSFETRQIPGTDLCLGKIEKVLQSATGEIITSSQTIGVRYGCGHEEFAAYQAENNGGCRSGPGQCYYCTLEAAALLSQHLITIQQAQAMQLYCPMCESHCDSCGRHSICVRHVTQFQNQDGTIVLLCPDCLKKAEEQKFFNDALAIILSPFVDRTRQSDR